MKRIFLTVTLTLLISPCTFCQVIPDIPMDDDILFEKLYLHIDRELYSPGDDIWLKSYLVNGTDNRLMPGFRNIYVQLIAEDGRVIDQRMMLSVNGVSNNDFHLPDTLRKGQYVIRGYTRYLQNFGEESLFYQEIAVSKATDLPKSENKPEEQKTIDVAFLPEGGSLVMNATNNIAFKAIDRSGKGIQVTGRIVDENGGEIATFESRYKGMGTFVMMQQEGKRYKAVIDGCPDFIFHFKEAKTNGIALHHKQDANHMQFILSRNIKSTDTKNLTLAVSHRGEELFREEVEMTGFQYLVEIYKGFFPTGISKVTLADAQQNILAERLVFVRNPDAKTLRITSDKNEYQPGEKVTLQMESLLIPEEDTLQGGLSIAVVNESYLSGDGQNQTIESYLLLDSELKGPIESPASCFTDEEHISTDEKLDLAMLVNGWRNYYRNDLLNHFRNPLPGRNDVGLTLQGEVKTRSGQRPEAGALVKLGPFSSLFLILKDTTDESGRFRFNRLYLKDSAQIMINAANKKGNSNVEISCESIPVFDSIAPVAEKMKINQDIRKIEIPEKFERSAYYRYLAERDFKMEEGSILIKEVEVKAELKSPVSITGVYGFPDRSYTLTDEDRENYSEILKYLEFEVPGIIDYGDGIRIGLGKKGPKIFVDGFQMDDHPDLLSMDNIEKVEIIHPSRFSFMMGVDAFGGPGGIISILTKSGFGKFNDEFKRIIHGRITPRVRGFRQAREFYSPKYPLAEQYSLQKKPDQRPTLYWNPYIALENGTANIEFYASDMPGRYRICAEGISNTGKIIFETGIINVYTKGKSQEKPIK